MNDADLATLGVIPTHWNLAQAQSRAAGEKKKFDIEPEPDGVHFLENRTANIETERFETALRVPKRHPGRNSDDEIENATGLFPPPRLVNTY